MSEPDSVQNQIQSENENWTEKTVPVSVENVPGDTILDKLSTITYRTKNKIDQLKTSILIRNDFVICSLIQNKN